MEDIEAKEKILKGAEELFMKYGVRSISMDDIARHLSVSKKTLYQHFVDKDDLVAKVLEMMMVDQKKKYDQINVDSTNAIDELGKISLCVRKDIEGMNPTLLHDIQKFHSKAWNVWTDFKVKFVRDSVMRNLSQGKKEGYFRPEIDEEILASFRLASIDAVFNDRIFPRSKFSFSEIHAQVFDLFVFGICTEEGRKLYQNYKEKNNNTLPHTTNHKHETIL